jgi:FtsH-binding integral membrane protein
MLKTVYLIVILLAIAYSGSGKIFSPVRGKLNVVARTQPFSNSFNGYSDSKPSYEYKNYQNDKLNGDFLTRDSRRGFINKVYAVFGSQILTTMFVVSYIMNNAAATALIQSNSGTVSVVSSVVTLGSLFALMSQNIAQKAPLNFILLGLFTIAQALSIGAYTVFINPQIVLTAAMHTLTAFLGITLFSATSRSDLTTSASTLVSLLGSALIGSVLNMFFKIPLLENLLAGFFAIMAATYIAYDTQMIVGGKHHKRSFRKNEYIIASLSLYQDVVMLFVELLEILKRMEESKNRKEER